MRGATRQRRCCRERSSRSPDFLPVGFARSTAGEYAGNIFWVVGFALIVSWIVAVVFTPYLGVKMLPAIKPIEGGHDAIYDTPNYRRLRQLITFAVRHKFVTVGVVGIAFALSGVGMGAVKQQFFPTSDRPEVLVEVRLPEGTSIETTTATVEKLEHWLDHQPEAKVVTSYVGQGAPRFFFAMAPELPDPAFAKIVVLTPDAEAREALKHRLREAVSQGLAPEAYVRVTQLVFGPYTPFPVEFRVMGPDPAQLYDISEKALAIMRGVPDVRQANRDWGNRTPVLRFIPDQDRLNLIGLSPAEVGQQLQFLLTGIAVTQVREDIRNVPIVARSAGGERLDPSRLADFSLMSRDGRQIPLDQIGHSEVRLEEPILKRRDRTPVITIRSDINEATQPPEVSKQIMTALQPLIASLPAGYRIEMGGSIEEAAKANTALGKVFPAMIAAMLIVIMLQVRSFSTMAMVLVTAPLGLVGVVPMLLIFNQPFGFNAILGSDRTGRHPDAQHADPDRTDQGEPCCRPRRLSRRHRGHGAAHAARDPDGACRRAGLHPAHALRLLGIDGLYADRRHGGRHGADPALPSRALCRVVPDQTCFR